MFYPGNKMFNLLIYDYCIRKGVKIKKKSKD